MKEKRKSKSGRNPKLDPAVYRYTVRFNEEEHNRFLAMFGDVYKRQNFISPCSPYRAFSAKVCHTRREDDAAPKPIHIHWRCV